MNVDMDIGVDVCHKDGCLKDDMSKQGVTAGRGLWRKIILCVAAYRLYSRQRCCHALLTSKTTSTCHKYAYTW